MYLTIAEKSYPRKLAFSYLDELSKEFATVYGPKVKDVRKPYAFVGFGMLPWIAFVDLLVALPLTSNLHRHIHAKNGTVVPGYEDVILVSIPS